jgi:hypothetical protein
LMTPSNRSTTAFSHTAAGTACAAEKTPHVSTLLRLIRCCNNQLLLQWATLAISNGVASSPSAPASTSASTRRWSLVSGNRLIVKGQGFEFDALARTVLALIAASRTGNALADAFGVVLKTSAAARDLIWSAAAAWTVLRSAAGR